MLGTASGCDALTESKSCSGRDNRRTVPVVLEMVRVTEAAAIAASHLIGRGDEKAADHAAVEAMRKAFDDTTTLIGKSFPRQAGIQDRRRSDRNPAGSHGL